MKKIVVIGLFVLFFVNGVPAQAAEGTTGDYMHEIGTKAARGFGNLLMSPGEIGCGIAKDTGERGGVGVVTGFGKGLLFMLRRMLVGVDEIVTFMIPMEPTLPPLCWAD